MLKTFRVFSRAVNKRGYTVGITQNVKAENVQAAISTVINKSAKAGLSGVITVSYTHSPSPRDRTRSRMPSSA